LQSTINNQASGSGGIASYFAGVLDSSLTITATDVSSSFALVPPPPSAPTNGTATGDDELEDSSIAGIVIGTVLGFLIILAGLAVVAQRRGKRLAVATITPDVGERALVQPPALPAEDTTPPPTADPPAPAGGLVDRVPMAAPVPTEEPSAPPAAAAEPAPPPAAATEAAAEGEAAAEVPPAAPQEEPQPPTDQPAADEPQEEPQPPTDQPAADEPAAT